MGNLTALAVKNATKAGRYRDGKGLMLIVRPTGGRSWIVRVQVDGRERDFGLGSLDDVTLAEAREKAALVRKQYREGIDPVAAKRAARLAMRAIPTFAEASARYREEHAPSWRSEKHRAHWLTCLEAYAFPRLGALGVDTIDAAMVRDVLLAIWLDKPETARRVRQRICAVLDWAHGNGYRPQEAPLRSINKGLPRQPKQDRHHAAMPFDSVPAFCQEQEAMAPTMGRLGLLFTIYTAARSGETRGATWAEIDLEAALWTIPADRMKAGRAHSVPLSPAALSILDKARAAAGGDNACGLIFTGRGGRTLSDMTLGKVLRDAGQPFTVHGFRSAFKDWAAELTNFPDAVSEAALAHGDPDKVRKAYRRTDFLTLRRDLMAAWADYVQSHGGKVLRFPTRAGEGISA